MALTAFTGFMIHYTIGLPSRFGPEEAIILNQDTWHSEKKYWLDCKSEVSDGLVPTDLCDIGAEDQSPSFLLWGDSHANAVGSAINLSAINTDVAGYMIWKSGCQPLVGIDRTDHKPLECSDFSREVLDFVRDHGEIDTVILSSRWAISAEGTRYKFEEGKGVILVDTDNPTSEKITNGVLFTTGLRRTIDELLKLDRQILLVSAVPEIGYHVPSAYFVASRTGRDITDVIAPSLEEYRSRNEVVLKVLDELTANFTNVQIVDPADILCDESVCQVVYDNQPLYIDDNHLSTFGAYRIAEIFDPIFEDLKNR